MSSASLGWMFSTPSASQRMYLLSSRDILDVVGGGSSSAVGELGKSECYIKTFESDPFVYHFTVPIAGALQAPSEHKGKQG